MISARWNDAIGLGRLALMCLALGCNSSSTNTNPAASVEPADVTIVSGSEPTEEQRSKMLAAKEALFTQLSGRLMQAMSGPGPAAAIAVCQKEAPKIAAQVGDEHGLRIGRTGVRLRNQTNVAPAWAEALIQAKTGTPTFALLSDGQAAALLPIQLQGQCVMCHGPKDQIAPAIQEQLSKLYPDDQATGFQEGDLRGWFWIELPAGG